VKGVLVRFPVLHLIPTRFAEETGGVASFGAPGINDWIFLGVPNLSDPDRARNGEVSLGSLLRKL
jgi:hypothetical protein